MGGYDLNTFDVELTTTPIRIPDLPTAFHGYRIGLVSDVHLGVYIPDDYVAHTFELLDRAGVDLLLLGGDFVWLQESLLSRWYGATLRNPLYGGTPSPELANRIFESLASMAATVRAPDGCLAVYGNHDKYVEPTLCEQALTRHGIQLLVNHHMTIRRGENNLMVFGTDDFWTGIPRVTVAKHKATAEVRVMLTHNPDFAALILEHTDYEFDLYLCGHTHGGQIRLPGIGALHYNIENTRFAAGLVQHPRGQVFTTRGTGVVEVPWRYNCRPEVSILELHPGPPLALAHTQQRTFRRA